MLRHFTVFLAADQLDKGLLAKPNRTNAVEEILRTVVCCHED